ncbi:hypothetical protein [Ignavibacterium album]|uniref:hypothetical protein n=1 Tax=Ignavibacterium album TaxID=591197 RepID=UPI0026F15E34|nr:hypothetical protein [Ignavibacterium album]
MKLNFVIIFLLALSSFIYSQSSSPYTRYGIGDLKYSFSARQQGMGQLGVSLLDKAHISTTNPASWADFNRTRIEFGLTYNGVSISDNNSNYYTAETEIEGFTFGFPVSSDYGIGIAAGLIPYSRISYKAIQDYQSTDTLISDYSITYEGKGGLSKLFIGSSVRVPFGFSFGATLDYYFGNLNYLSTLTFKNEDNYTAEYSLSYRPTGFGTTAGFISSNLNEILKAEFLSDIRLGASINYISKLDTDTILTTTSSILVDTIAQSRTKFEIPLRINLGLSFIIGKNYLVTIDYSSQNFNNFKIAGNNINELRDGFKFSTGFEFIPTQQLGMTFWERVNWRFGLSYEKTPYYFRNTGIDQYSIYSGLTFPLGSDNSIDMALQYSLRGTTENNLLKENFIKLNLGISFGELWFLRYEK